MSVVCVCVFLHDKILVNFQTQTSIKTFLKEHCLDPVCAYMANNCET